MRIFGVYIVRRSDYLIPISNFFVTVFQKNGSRNLDKDFFDKKKPIYLKSKVSLSKSLVDLDQVGKDTSINRINKYLKTFDKWDKAAIIERQKMFFVLSKFIWQIKTIE
jgi:hypothetical protein